MKAIIFSIFIIAGSLQLNAQCWQQVSAGTMHSMGIKQDGTLWGWGRNNTGQLGDGTNINKSAAIEISPLTHWQSISTGYEHTIAIKHDSTLWTWGSNEFGQIGDGTLIDKNIPVQVGAHHWLQASAGFGHNIAIRQDGTLWSWGWNASWQLGDSTNVMYKTTPGQIGTDNNWKSISAGAFFNLAMKQDGTLWAWGWNDDGELGDGTFIFRNSPVQVGIATDWKIIAAGGHSMAIKQDGTLWCWGSNDYGQIGDGSVDERNTPQKIGTDTNWLQISAGSSHSMAIKKDGTLWLWGDNGNGQIGDGSPPFFKVAPLQLGTATDWINISAGDDYSLALKQNGHLWSWGSNNTGQLGDGTNVDKNIATYIPNCWPLKTDNISEASAVILIYPNPASTRISVRCQMLDGGHAKVEMYNSLGQLLFTTENNEIDMSNYSRGMYYLKIANAVKKVIIE